VRYLFTLIILIADVVYGANGSACNLKVSPKENASAVTIKACENLKASPQCQAIYKKINLDGGDLQDKQLRCDEKSLSRSYSVISSLNGCMVYGLFDATFGSMGKFIGESFAESDYQRARRKERLAKCNNSVTHKKNIFLAYNESVPRVLQVKIPSEAELNSTNCEKLYSNLERQQRGLERQASLKYTYNPSHRTSAPDSREKEYLEWKSKQDKKFDSLPGPQQGLLSLAYEKLGEFGVRLECYNAQAAAALTCESIFYIASGYGMLRSAAFKALAGFNQINSEGKVVAAGMKAEELMPKEYFDKFADGLTQEKYGKIIRGEGTANDPKAVQYVGDGLNHAPPPGSILFQTGNFKSEPNPLRLLTPADLYNLPEGTVLEDIVGNKVIKGVDHLDDDTRMGLTAYGFREKNFVSKEKYTGPLKPNVREEIRIINQKKAEISSLKKNLRDLSVQKEEEQMVVGNAEFRRARGDAALEDFAKGRKYSEVSEYRLLSDLMARKKIYTGNQAVVRYIHKRTGKTFELEGEIVGEYVAGFELKDTNGFVHFISQNDGKIDKFFVKAKEAGEPLKSSRASSPELVRIEKETIKTQQNLETAQKAENEAREIIYQGSSLVDFSTPEKKKIFFEGAKKIRQQEIIVAPSKEQAVQKNIELNKTLGRAPVSIDSNGIPVYAPGTSYFRAMVIKPGDEAIAKRVLSQDGWKSGYDRGVTVSPESLGKAGNGATRLSDQAPFTDSVVEFVGPKANLGKGFENGFAFPRDSRAVGTASSTAVVDVAIKTAGNLPKGSYVMVTEMVPRNRQLVNSSKLMGGRKIQSKFPLVYDDGGVEHAVSGVDTDEIVNVLFIPIEK
jgi:hypothetical protein